MKQKQIGLVYAIILAFILINVSCSYTQKINSPNGISKIQYLNINGTKQYILIRGENTHNPILLFLHGGPGSSATPLLRKYNFELEKYFTVIYWDQRNAGKSYHKNTPKQTIQVANYLQDIDTLVYYLKAQFNKEKVFLVGHSWGARLGLYAIKRHPENYIAYVGIGQEVAAHEGELISYDYTLKKAKEQGNIKALHELEQIGPPQSGEYARMYKNGFGGLVTQKQWLLKLGGERYAKTNYADWIKSIWLSDEYSILDLINYSKASRFSSGNIINDVEFNNFNFFEQIPEVKVPVFFISGLFDYNTPWQLVEKYCTNLNAPYKEFILFDKSGHSPVFEESEKFNREIVRIYSTVLQKT
ncbi:MAG: alpha/beta hydrolase [Bacteroidia bacterium]|jgi:pimeloyl-ACP methyl ester carboxylesterase|nr:alpha/beta hydrolase [Bacteroidia bacterium]